jgi:hypothetical protein
MMWKEMVKPNCIRDSSSAVASIGALQPTRWPTAPLLSRRPCVHAAA